MRRPGHYGTAMLVYAPFGAWLALAEFPGLAVVGGASVLALSMLPDVDIGIPLVPHRGPTHSLVFAVAVGVALGTGLATVVGAFAPDAASGDARHFGFVVGAVAVIAHLVADALTPAGVPLLWPVSGRRFSVSLWPAASPVGNWLLFALGLAAVAGAAHLVGDGGDHLARVAQVYLARGLPLFPLTPAFAAL